MRIVGIDPGVHGGIALYLPDATVPTMPNGLQNLPIVDGELNYTALRDTLWEFKPDRVFLELSTGFMPNKKNPDGSMSEEKVKFGSTSLFKFGGAYYSIKAVVACLNLPLRVVTPKKWKGHFRLKGGEGGKEQARKYAIELFPAIAPFLKFKNTHQKAEAFLIAAYGAGIIAGESYGSGSRVYNELEHDDDDIPDPPGLL